MTTLGLLAAFGASVSWAYASTQYARFSREAGAVRVNFVRTTVALPIFAVALLLVNGASPLAGVTASGSLWLLLSVISSYAMADSLFFVAARRIGVTTALSIGSMYPLWAALWGTVIAGEPFGWGRAAGTLLAVAGIVWLVRLAGGSDPAQPSQESKGWGFVLAFLVSILWAANSISVKRGAVGLGLAQVNTLRYGFAVLLLAPQLLRRTPPKAQTPFRNFAPVLPAVLCDAVIGSGCYVYGLSHTDLAVGSTLTSLAPLISVPVALALGEEGWNMRRFGAVVTTVAGVVLLVTGGGW